MKIILYKFIENNKVNIDLTVNKNQDDTHPRKSLSCPEIEPQNYEKKDVYQ